MDTKLDTYAHPDYEWMAARWQMAWDFWRGGIFVLRPNRRGADRSIAGMPVVNSDDPATAGGLASEMARKASRFEWVGAREESYLWKHERESNNAFADRQARQTHLPVFQAVINILVAGILRVDPTRPEGDAWWQQYHDDADMAGTPFNSLMRQVLSLAIVFGRMHILTDQQSPAVAPLSRQDEAEAGIRPYSYLVTPLDLVDWRLDRYGQFEWIRIREPMPDTRGPLDSPLQVPRSQYRVWTREVWQLWRPVDWQSRSSSSEQFELAAGGSHGLGRVPIRTTWAMKDSRRASMACESPLCDILDGDRMLLNRLSEGDELDRASTFHLWWFPSVDGQKVGEIAVGPWAACEGPFEAGPPQIVGPPGEHVEGKYRRAREMVYDLRQLAGVGRGRAEYSKEERSASAISVESEDKRNQMSWWASSLEQLDHGVHDDVAMWRGEKAGPKASYPKSFDLKSASLEIQDLVQLKTLETVPPSVLAAMVKPVVAKLLREHGIVESDIQAQLAAIDADVERREQEAEKRRKAAVEGRGAGGGDERPSVPLAASGVAMRDGEQEQESEGAAA